MELKVKGKSGDTLMYSTWNIKKYPLLSWAGLFSPFSLRPLLSRSWRNPLVSASRHWDLEIERMQYRTTVLIMRHFLSRNNRHITVWPYSIGQCIWPAVNQLEVFIIIKFSELTPHWNVWEAVSMWSHIKGRQELMCFSDTVTYSLIWSTGSSTYVFPNTVLSDMLAHPLLSCCIATFASVCPGTLAQPFSTASAAAGQRFQIFI